MIEGLASMAVVFIMLTVLVQVSLAMTARSAADAAVTAAARRAALPGAEPAVEAERLATDIEHLVLGATKIAVDVEVRADRSVARAAFGWRPPGPVLTPLTIRVAAEVPRAIPP